MNQSIIKKLALASSVSLLVACAATHGPSSSTPLTANASTTSNSVALVMGCEPVNTPVSLQSHSQVTLVEAENFDGCNPQAGANSSLSVLASDGASEGFYIGQKGNNSFAQYSLVVNAAGIYNLVFTAKTQNAAAAQLVISIDGQNVGQVNVANTQWADVPVEGVYLSGGKQTLKVSFEGAGAQLDTLTLSSTENDTLTANEIVARMGTGINLGNTLDLPKGQDWGAQPEAEHYFDDFKAAGFGHVRIPVTWDGATALTPPYAIDPAFMQRVETTVDWALERGFYVILNAHHEAWFKEDYPTKDGKPTDNAPTPAQAAEIAKNNARLEAIWVQVAEHFKNKPKRLLMELLNEPFGMTTAQVDEVNPRLLAIVRATNPNRAVIYSGPGYSAYYDLMAAKVPAGDNLIANFHLYDPWPFGGQCAQRWGSDEDKAALRKIYQQVADWAKAKNVPVTVNEFNAALYDWEKPHNICNTQDRKHYLRSHVELQKELGMPGTVWDDDGSFRVYDRKTGQWDVVLDSLIF